MDTIGVARLATALSQTSLQDQAQVAVFKKALQAQSQAALALISALPQPSGPAHLGQRFDASA